MITTTNIEIENGIETSMTGDYSIDEMEELRMKREESEDMRNCSFGAWCSQHPEEVRSMFG